MPACLVVVQHRVQRGDRVAAILVARFQVHCAVKEARDLCVYKVPVGPPRGSGQLGQRFADSNRGGRAAQEVAVRDRNVKHLERAPVCIGDGFAPHLLHPSVTAVRKHVVDQRRLHRARFGSRHFYPPFFRVGEGRVTLQPRRSRANQTQRGHQQHRCVAKRQPGRPPAPLHSSRPAAAFVVGPPPTPPRRPAAVKIGKTPGHCSAFAESTAGSRANASAAGRGGVGGGGGRARARAPCQPARTHEASWLVAQSACRTPHRVFFAHAASEELRAWAATAHRYCGPRPCSFWRTPKRGARLREETPFFHKKWEPD